MTELRTKRLCLRPPRLDDLADLHAVYADPEVMRYWSTPPHPDLETTRAHLGAMVAGQRTPTQYFVIERDGRAIGCAGVHDGDEIGFLLHHAHWRQGIMSEALGTLIPYFFDTLGFDRLTADADPNNAGSTSLLLSLGFRETGRAERTFFINGVWSDSVYFALDREGR